jgi:hypothetical protein
VRTYVIIDRGPERTQQGDRFIVSQYAEDGSSTSMSSELLLTEFLRGWIPTRHLVEELAKRVNCHVVVDDDPDPLTVDEPEVPCTCIGVGTLWSPTPGEHHQRDCILYLPPGE